MLGCMQMQLATTTTVLWVDTAVCSVIVVTRMAVAERGVEATVASEVAWAAVGAEAVAETAPPTLQLQCDN